MNEYEVKALKVRQQVSKVTKEQQGEILKIYDNAIVGISEKMAKAKSGSVTEKFLLENRKEMKKVRKKIFDEINQTTKNGVATAAKMAIDNDIDSMTKVLKKSGVKVGQSYKSMFFGVQEKVVNDIISGDLYKDAKTLSDRIWNMTGNFEKDIQSVIAQGILEKKSAIELAKDLEDFVLPPAKRPATWGKAYPRLKNKAVDYNAQRLARTAINHSYQTATVQGSNVNPFVEGIKWRSAEIHGRTCALCIERANDDAFGLGAGVFPKDEVPLDHPNGLCTMLPHVPQDLDTIAEELNKWIHGEDNPKLDSWYDEQGEYFSGGLKKPPKIDTAKIGQLDTQIIKLQQDLKDLNQSEFVNIWKDPVHPSDYLTLQNKIQMKQDYYSNKLIQDPPNQTKWQGLKDTLAQFEIEGKKYASTYDELIGVQKEFNNLLPAMKNPYSPERKNTAYWFTNQKEADDLFRSPTGKIWNTYTPLEREAAYEYTAGSGKFNRPLRGYDGGWGKYNFKGIGNVPLDNEGGEKYIKALDGALERSSYDFDVWLTRGVENDGLDAFVGIETGKYTEDEVKQLLIGKVVKDEGFMSTAAAEGKGFPDNKLKIYAPKNTKMLYCEPFAHYGDGVKSANWDGVETQNYFSYEFEVLIRNGYEYKITDVKKGTGYNSRYDLEIEVVLPE